MAISTLYDSLKKRCKGSGAILCLPEFLDQRVKNAALELLEERLIEKVVMFSKDDLQGLSGEAKTKFIFAGDLVDGLGAECSKLIKDYSDLRTKAISESEQLKLANDPLLQACYLLKHKKVDAVVAGAVYTTAQVIRHGLIALPKSSKYISSSFFFEQNQLEKNSRSFLFADAGVIAQPSLEQLLDIAESSVATWKTLSDETPIVAFLSYATGDSASGPQVGLMANAAIAFKEKCPKISAVGPIQFDAAWDVGVGLKKKVPETIAGKANVFVFPDLNAANISYKIAQRLGGYKAYGPLLQGFSQPYSDLSRGCSKDEIKTSCLIQVLKHLEDKG